MAEDILPVQSGGQLPDKKYFKIGETSTLLGVKPHVLRYWETEFPQIRPFKSKTGQRMYRKRDVEALMKIQRLLYQERFTIAGARQALRANWATDRDDDSAPAVELETLSTPVQTATAHVPQIMWPEYVPAMRLKLLTAKAELERVLEALA